jgi:hypothetical protein
MIRIPVSFFIISVAVICMMIIFYHVAGTPEVSTGTLAIQSLGEP